MRISKQWIEDYVSLPKKAPEDMGEELTVHTVEVEDVIAAAEDLQQIVVGKVTAVEPHPNADALQVCQVDVGGEALQVVCGGANVRKDMLVAMGMVGAQVLWHGEGEPVTLKKTNIRGEQSLGMICAAEEIGLDALFPKTAEKDILDLTDVVSAKPGTPLAEALGLSDSIFDIDNKSMTHRPDLWGHYGMAREFAALYKTKLTPLSPPDVAAGKGVELKVDIKEPKLCARYCGVVLDGIVVEPSPEWMQKRLLAVGVQPINNIVDITNYVMFELGEPMHAFDAETINKEQGTKNKKTIAVRKAKKGEKAVLLGGDEVELTPNNVVIADKDRVVALAGVKGGEDSGVTENTTSIIFEAAHFDALSVRRTATAVGIRTDASSRFEKTLDPTLPPLAIRRAVELTLQLCPNAQVVSNLADEGTFTLDKGPITLSADHIRSRIGVELKTKDMVAMLERVGFTVEGDGEQLAVTIPSWRATGDIAIPEDIVEEVARMYGYANIPQTLPAFPITPTPASPLRDLAKQITELLALEAGYTEVYNYSFVSPEWLGKLQVDVDQHIELAHPLAKDRPFVRRSLLPNMLENVERNLHREDAVRLFETGRTYRTENTGAQAAPDAKEQLPGQDTLLGMVYAEKGNDTPFFALSSALRTLADRLGAALTLVPAKDQAPYLHNGRQAQILVDGKAIGHIAELHPQVQEDVGIPHRCAVLELNISALTPLVGERIAYTPLPAYPAVERDLAIVVDRKTAHADVVATAKNAHALVDKVALFDMYEGDHVPENKKSLAYHIFYRAEDKTLKAEEAEAAHEAVLQALTNQHNAEIRS